MASELPPLPNPLTPLAWLPPDIAGQLEASRYLYAATLGAWIWDVLMALPDEFRMLVTRRASLSDAAYVLARLASGAFITTSFVFQVSAVSDCHALAKAIGWCGAFGLSLNSLLFFFRVKAVFNSSKLITALFAFVWFATFACALTAPFGVDGIHIGTTGNCVNSNVKTFSSAGLIVVAVNDTLVFIAISTRLMMYSLADTWVDRFKTFFSGKGMGHMSRALLQTGQLYYLVTVGVNIVAMVVILTPSVPPVLRAMFAIPNVALQNAMACRVFRLIKLGMITDKPVAVSSLTPPAQSFRLYQNASRPNRDGSAHSQGDVENFKLTTSPSFRNANGNAKLVPVHVDINRETEVTVDGLDRREWKAGSIA
ncbi:unnamed protein product [Somion occarium]|uniref:Transmembrane protein n=1 Tax=Somion occarium TaxID=3059160 RepID=A0ABP1D3M0_9APHY